MAILSVALPFTEADFETPMEFASLAEANAFLAKVTPPELGYYKTDFAIIWTDGAVYNGRFDIGADAPTLEEHCRAFLDVALAQENRISRRLRRPENAEELAYFRGMAARFQNL